MWVKIDTGALHSLYLRSMAWDTRYNLYSARGGMALCYLHRGMNALVQRISVIQEVLCGIGLGSGWLWTLAERCLDTALGGGVDGNEYGSKRLL